MRTLVEDLNAIAGSKLFAERLDECGLPVDGWAFPQMMVAMDEKERMVKIHLGTFKVSEDWFLSRCAVNVEVSNQEYRRHRDGAQHFYGGLLRRLIDELRSR